MVEVAVVVDGVVVVVAVVVVVVAVAVVVAGSCGLTAAHLKRKPPRAPFSSL